MMVCFFFSSPFDDADDDFGVYFVVEQYLSAAYFYLNIHINIVIFFFKDSSKSSMLGCSD